MDLPSYKMVDLSIVFWDCLPGRVYDISAVDCHDIISDGKPIFWTSTWTKAGRPNKNMAIPQEVEEILWPFRMNTLWL